MRHEVENSLEDIKRVVDLIVSVESIATTEVTTPAKDYFYSEAGSLLNKLLLSFKK